MPWKEVKVGFALKLSDFRSPHELGYSWIAKHKSALGVFHVDGVRNGIDESTQDIPFFRQLLLRLFADDELANLTADRTHHPKQLLVRFLDLSAEKFDDAENFLIQLDRKAESRVQRVLYRTRCAGEASVIHHIDNPG